MLYLNLNGFKKGDIIYLIFSFDNGYFYDKLPILFFESNSNDNKTVDIDLFEKIVSTKYSVYKFFFSIELKDNCNKGLGINLNRKKETNNNKFGYGFKRDLAPVIMKEKKTEDFYDFNSGNSGNNNNVFGRKDKFSLYERNNPLFNQFNSGNNDIIGASRRKKNYYSSPNSLGWDLI